MATLFDAKGNRLMYSSEVFEPFNLVVMCFNVQYWGGLNGDMALMQSIIDTYNPDIIAFQEYEEWLESGYVYNTILSEYPHHYMTSSLDARLGIVSKFEFVDFAEIAYGAQGQENRGYIKAHFVFNHLNICLFNTHLEILGSNNASVRAAQAAELLDAMKTERYAICTGDFNVPDCYDTTSYEYITNIKPFLDEGYHSANSSDQHGFLATYYSGTTVDDYTSYGCIDEIITTSNIDINMVTVDKQKSDANTDGLALDHLPIVAYCRVNG